MRQSYMPKQKTLLLIAFVSGTAVTAMEISASRLLAPFFGTSQLVWTNVIGVVLAALALGYYIGGRISESFPHLRALLRIIFFAGCLCLLIPWVARPLAQTAAALRGTGTPGFVFFGSLLVSALLFGIPIALLGMTSPFLIKIATAAVQSRSPENAVHAGSASGKIFAWSTVGSILGTFLPTLVLTPLIGTRLTIEIFAAVLVVLGSFGFARTGVKIFAAAAILILAAPIRGPVKPAEQLLAEKESQQQFIQILQGSRGFEYLTINEGAGIQSIYNPDRTTTGFYYDAMTLLPRLFNPQQQPVKVLVIGVAGGTVPRAMAGEYGSKIQMDGVEIDPAVTALAKKYFNFSSVPIQMHFTDGRVFLASDSQKYDLIIVDAYQNELYIPFTLATKEFWSSVQAHLNSGGILAMNINASSDHSKLFNALANTVAKVFPDLNYTGYGSGSFNFLLVGSEGPPDFSKLYGSNNPDLQTMADLVVPNFKTYQYNPNALVLTDDRSPLEFLTEQDLGYLER